jgi:hypothetical protein
MLGLALIFGSVTSQAAPIQITVQGQLTLQEPSTEFMGITDASVPVQISFVAEDSLATYFAAGTPVKSGAAFTSDAYFLPRTSLSNFVANIGNASFSQDDLYPGFFFDHGYDVVLLGSLSTHGVSGALIGMVNPNGSLFFGTVGCNLTCQIGNYGYGESVPDGGLATITGIQVSAQRFTQEPVAVPQPGTLALLGAGMIALAARRRRGTPVQPT